MLTRHRPVNTQTNNRNTTRLLLGCWTPPSSLLLVTPPPFSPCCHTPHTLQNAQDTTRAVDALLDAIVNSVADGKEVTIPGFGSFKPRHRAARAGRNPKTGEALKIAAKTSPSFAAGEGAASGTCLLPPAA